PRVWLRVRNPRLSTRRHPMSAPDPNAPEYFVKIALEYYVNGRAAGLAGCLFTTGNLFHHAVEMILKGKLSQTVPLRDLSDRKKFHHSLAKCWEAFKALFPTENLAEFDPMIAELDKFENIRYPEKLYTHGAARNLSLESGVDCNVGNTSR